jgi:glyoxylase-like metal-dependent hydrolase (beta-lactamase superfamily II)
MNNCTLLPETLLCPGHGPLTTVVEVKEHSPFSRSSRREEAHSLIPRNRFEPRHLGCYRNKFQVERASALL